MDYSRVISYPFLTQSQVVAGLPESIRDSLRLPENKPVRSADGWHGQRPWGSEIEFNRRVSLWKQGEWL